MPLNILGSVLTEGTKAIPYYDHLVRYGPYFAGAAFLKWIFAGASNTWDRDLHGRVILLTGGTSGMGIAVAYELAKRGCQLILLVRSNKDTWTADYIEDLKEKTGNLLIYAEECDLSDLLSVRKFATRWLDNTPPRRLDMVICCAATAIPPGAQRCLTRDGLEQHLQINYLAHYHLLTLLSPSLRVQPPDRDVRVILTSCIATSMASFDLTDMEFVKRGYPSLTPYKVNGASKLSLIMFAFEYQQQINEYKRPDNAATNVRTIIADPGVMRTPSFRRFMSFGSLWGLLLYLVLWPFYWLIVKSSRSGAESILHAVMAPSFEESRKVSYVKNCKERPPPPRPEIYNEDLRKKLFKWSETAIAVAEKRSATRRKQAQAQEPTTQSKPSKASRFEPVDSDEKELTKRRTGSKKTT